MGGRAFSSTSRRGPQLKKRRGSNGMKTEARLSKRKSLRHEIGGPAFPTLFSIQHNQLVTRCCQSQTLKRSRQCAIGLRLRVAAKRRPNAGQPSALTKVSQARCHTSAGPGEHRHTLHWTISYITSWRPFNNMPRSCLQYSGWSEGG